MTDTTNNLVPNKGKLWRFVTAVGAWLQGLEYTSFDYTQDRIDRLERKVAGADGRVESGPREAVRCKYVIWCTCFEGKRD